MKEKKIAVLSDIHGNTWALSEVLADIKTKKVQSIINLGDSLNGPLDPVGTFNLLTENNVVSISGNGDRLILESLGVTSTNHTEAYVKSQMNNDIIEWLKGLPFDLVSDNIYCCHASPNSDMEYLLESLKSDHVATKENPEIDTVLNDIKQEIVVCGHSHLPRTVKINKKIIHNVGSVGLPAYDDELPIPHKMENFSPHARYSILTLSEKAVNIEQIVISYDYEPAARKAEENKRYDWAKWIRTGKV